MSLKKDIISAEVQIGSNEAQASLIKLTQHTSSLTNENERLRISQAKLKALGKESENEYKQLTAKIKDNNTIIKENRSQMDALRKTIGLTELSSKQLRSRATDLRRELSNMNKSADPAQWNKLNNELIATERQFKKVQSQVGHTAGFMTKMNKIAGGLLPAFGFAAILYGLKRIGQAAIDKFTSFESRVSNLSAITQLEGENLQWLTEKAKEFSTATREDGIVITQSAEEIVDAFTKMGSARPELLKNKEALAEVTESALILAEAAKIELEPAIAAVASVMNQFDLDASETSRVINAIAAGSLEGSAEVDSLTESMKNVGTVASDSNMSLEQTVASLEILAEKQLLGAEAGTKLRGALLKMKDAGVGYASGQFNLRDALIEVNTKLNQQGSELERDALKQKIFGTENITAGNILLQNIEKYDQLTKAVTGTNVAMEQASKNTDNAKASMTQAKNEFALASIQLGQSLTPAMVKAYKLAGSMASAFAKMISDSPAESLRKEGIEVNRLAIELTNSNTSLARRKRILDELKTINPDIISGLDAENLNYETLKKNLHGYNEELSNRILLENLSDDEKKYATKVARYKESVGNFQLLISDIIKKTDEDIALSNDTFENKIAKTFEILQEKARGSVIVIQGVANDARNAEARNLSALESYVIGLTRAQNSLNDATGKAQDFTARIDALREILGIEEQIIETKKEKKPGGSSGSGGGSDSGDDKSKDQIKKEIEALETAYSQKQSIIKKNYLEGKITEDQYNADLLLAELNFLNDKLKIYKVGSKEYEDTVNNALEKEIASDKITKDLLLKAQKELEKAKMDEAQNNVDAATLIDPNFATLDQQKEFFDSRIELIKVQFDQEKALAKENQSALLAAEKQYNAKLYQVKSDQIDAEFFLKEKRIGTAQSYIDQLSGIVDQESSLGKALFLFGKALAIGEVWINIAKANAKAIAASPLTFGQPWVSINTGMGIAQTALITAQAVSSFVKKGKKSGGFTSQYSSDDQVVDYVHANEFVANARAVRNPTVKPILDIIDIAQRNGSIATINLAAILGAIGRRAGGYESSASSNTISNSTVNTSKDIIYQKDAELLQAIKELNAELKKGIKAKLIYREFEEYKEKVDTIRNNASL